MHKLQNLSTDEIKWLKSEWYWIDWIKRINESINHYNKTWITYSHEEVFTDLFLKIWQKISEKSHV